MCVRYAVNALSASASVFESVYDVDHKFAKSMDKECEGMITEVKKWFKKLAVRLFTSFITNTRK